MTQQNALTDAQLKQVLEAVPNEYLVLRRSNIARFLGGAVAVLAVVGVGSIASYRSILDEAKDASRDAAREVAEGTAAQEATQRIASLESEAAVTAERLTGYDAEGGEAVAALRARTTDADAILEQLRSGDALEEIFVAAVQAGAIGIEFGDWEPLQLGGSEERAVETEARADGLVLTRNSGTGFGNATGGFQNLSTGVRIRYDPVNDGLAAGNNHILPVSKGDRIAAWADSNTVRVYLVPVRIVWTSPE